MRFYGQNDLISHWEGGKSYRQDGEGGTVTVISDQARTIPWVTQKFFEVKALHASGMSRGQAQSRLGAVDQDGNVVADARYRVVHPGGRSEERHGVFLHAFVSDCYSLWEDPLKA